MPTTAAGSVAGRTDLSRATQAAKTHTTRAAPKRQKPPVKFLGGLVTAVAIGAGVYYLAPRGELENVPVAETSSGFTDTPGVTPPREEAPTPAVPPPIAPMVEAPPPAAPARETRLNAALAAAEASEQSGDPAEAISGWLRVAREFPESDTPRKRLDFVIDPLRSRPEVKKADAYTALKPLLVEAAQLDSLSAVLLLAQAEHGRNLRESFAWFSTAASKGQPEAAREVGLILSNGLDQGPELKKAFYYFTIAAEADDVPAKTALAECYLLAKGTALNFERGIKWLKEAAAQNDLRAMNRLADGYDHGNFNLPVNYDEAFRLWSRVVETKDPTNAQRQPIGEANGNLGVLYMNGHGTTRDEKRAVRHFREGERLGDGNSMFNLGRCTQEGFAGIPKNAAEAVRLMKRGAEAGSRAARGWCLNNGVIYDAK